jgi:hypothetical protein
MKPFFLSLSLKNKLEASSRSLERGLRERESLPIELLVSRTLSAKAVWITCHVVERTHKKIEYTKRILLCGIRSL